MDSAGFPGKVGIEIVHEVGELLGILDAQEKMVVIRKEYEGVEFHWVEPLSSAKNSQDDGFQFVGGFEEKATPHSPTGDFHQCPASRYEP